METIDIMTLNIVKKTMTLDFVWMSHRGTHILTGSLPVETLSIKSVHIRSFSDPYFPAFRHSNWIRRDTLYLSAFSPNTGKYGPEKLRIRPFFTQWKSSKVFKYSEIITDKPLIVVLLWTGMWCSSLLMDAFLQSKQFMKKCACPVLSVYCTIKKWLLKVKFSQKYQVFLSKKFKVNLEQISSHH